MCIIPLLVTTLNLCQLTTILCVIFDRFRYLNCLIAKLNNNNTNKYNVSKNQVKLIQVVSTSEFSDPDTSKMAEGN